MTIDQLKALTNSGAYRALHTAMYRGYISRRSGAVVVPYAGIYGTGYKVLEPNWGSTRYSFVTYYVAAK